MNEEIGASGLVNGDAGAGINPNSVVVDPGFVVVAEPTKKFEIKIECRPRVCYALSYNKVPHIKSISVRNVGGGVSGQLTVKVGMKWTAAQQPPMVAKEIVIDCPNSGSTAQINGDSFRLDDSAMVDIAERTTAKIVVSVRDQSGLEESSECDIELLARNQWLNDSDLYELTAAFVQPNHPTVNEILKDASAILLRETGSNSLEGYQSGPQRAHQIGSAVFMALQGRIDNYINPPAGWETEGQKLRPIDEVLEQRQGTCIDLACAYASCLAQVGLNPIIFMVHGHAFAGFSLSSSSMKLNAVERNFSTVISLIETGEIIAAETVCLAQSNKVPFADAQKLVREHMRDSVHDCDICGFFHKQNPEGIAEHPHLEALINVSRCHKDGILPLPARVVRDGIITLVIDNGPTLPPIVERRDEVTLKVLPNTVPARVQQWKNSLLDLSFRNSLLNFRPGATGIELLVPSKRLGFVEDQLSAGNSIQVNPADGLSAILKERGIRTAQNIAETERDEILIRSMQVFGMNESGPFATRIRNLNSKARAEEQDTGSNNLFITFGSLKWSDSRSDVKEVVSPIFMLPIRLVMKRGSAVAQIIADESATTTVNFCLVEALRAKRGLKLDWFSSDMSDESGIDVDRGLQELRKEILDQRLTDQGFEVIENCSIGLLRFSKIRLWKDLDDHWELFARNPIVNHLVEGMRGQPFVDPSDPTRTGVPAFSDSDLMNPQPADGAQSRAVWRALAKQSFVLEGPPGTGKSQTITNLLANALATGRKVLFVAEKQSALEVVKERLTSVGLDPFCLDLHDKGSRPEDIKTQLRAALDFQPNADIAKWEDTNKKFDGVARVLEGYRNKLHGANTNGTSYFDAYARLLEIGDGPVATVTRKLFDVPSEKISEWRGVLGEIESYILAARPKAGHPWSFAQNVSFDTLDRARLASVVEGIRVGLALIANSHDPWMNLVKTASSVEEMNGLTAVMKVVEAGASPAVEGWRDVIISGWSEKVEGALQEIESTLTAWRNLDPALPLLIISEDHSSMLADVKVAADSFVLGRKGKVKKALGSLAELRIFAEAEPQDVIRALEKVVATSIAFREKTSKLLSIRGLIIPTGWSPLSEGALSVIHARVALLSIAAEFLKSGSELANQALAAAGGLAIPTVAQISGVTQFVEAQSSILEMLGSSENSLAFWRNERSYLESLSQSIGGWIEDVEDGTYRSLQRWLSFVQEIGKLDDESVASFRRELMSGTTTGEHALAAFDRALMSVTMSVVGQDNDLDVFDYTVHNRRVSDFISILQDREIQLRKVIPSMLYSSRTFNAASGGGAIGQLRTELNSKKRGARSVRGLLSKYPDLVLSLAPCFLMSPDSIAKFLEPGKIGFDLVIFDEASQITVSSAIGALGRAEAAVIVGDSRQMPPTAVAVASTKLDVDEVTSRPDDEEEAVITDSESILDECLESGLDQEWLAWHYRSRDELLIKFSNDKYYEGRLSSFPSPWLNVPGCGIAYHRVHGQFDHGSKRTNEIEADAIAAEVKRRANDSVLRKNSIGIVTMNLEQRSLIQEKLTKLNDPAVTALLDSEDDQENLFVLNLESVQGRERDVIILGTSFSARIGGGKMPLNFGPLTLNGGERRLNVAVTRARRQMVVFSSFDPEELSEANSLGMTHLYEYLKLARAAGAGDRPEPDAPGELGDDLHRSIVAQALREKGLIVKSGVGLSTFKVDLAVTLPGFEDRWLVGVLLDGRIWASRPLVLDRDAMPTTVLNNLMGWRKISRVWLPSWRSDSTEIVENIYDAAVQISQIPEIEPEPIPETVIEAEVVEEVKSDSSEVTVVEQDLKNLGESNDGSHPTIVYKNQREFQDLGPVEVVGSVQELDKYSPRAQQYLRALVLSHGPMHLDKAIKITARAFDLSVVREQRLMTLRGLVDESMVVDTEFGLFLYPPGLIGPGGDLSSFDWFRKSDFAQRTIQEIPPHEAANLLVAITRDAFSISPEELAAEMLRFFGYSRKKSEAAGYADRLVEWTVNEGYLKEEDGRLSAK